MGGARPAPLPGMGKPGAAPLPGMGKPGAAPLPGMGKPGAAPAGKPGAPAAPKGPSKEQIQRDPFASRAAEVQVAEYMPAPSASPVPLDDKLAATVTASSGMTRQRKLMLVGVAVVLLVGGFALGYIVAGRMERAIMIRDARIIQYEMTKLSKIFADVDGAITGAYKDAQGNTYNTQHRKILAEKLQGNPFNPSVFADRNFKNFDPATLQALNAYYDAWTELYMALGTHFRLTEVDEPELAATGEEFARLQQPSFGVVFARDESSGTLIANLVVLGRIEEKDGKKLAQVQLDVGQYGDEKTLYDPKPGDAEFSKTPEDYVIPIEPQTEGGLLKDSVKAHFAAYTERLKELADLVAKMREMQGQVTAAIDKIAAESPPSLLAGGVDVEQGVADYIQGATKAAAGVSAEGAEGGEKAAEKPAE